MNAVTSIWREMMRRRLWPVAVLLVAALVAIPVLLARDAEPVAAPLDAVPAVTAKADDTIAEPVVAKAEASDRGHRRRVLGARKDPFEPVPVKAPKKAKAAEAQPDQQPKADTTGGGPTAPTGDAPAPTPKAKVYPADSLIVRWGDAASGSLVKQVLRKGEPLPEDIFPLIVYLGLTDHGTKAEFLVDDALEVTGDGTCKPHPSNCETIELAAGETEFFDVAEPETGEIIASFQLDLVKINR